MAHSITIQEQKKVLISEVLEVNGFSEKEIKITLNGNEKLLIFGQDMKISAFNKENGNFVADGKIIGVKYLGKSVSFIKKLIK